MEDGTILDENGELEQLSLVDAVLPDIIATRHTLLHNRALKQVVGVKQESNADSNHCSHVNSLGHGEIMEVDGTPNDVGNQKALILKGHQSEVHVQNNMVIYFMGTEIYRQTTFFSLAGFSCLHFARLTLVKILIFGKILLLSHSANEIIR